MSRFAPAREMRTATLANDAHTVAYLHGLIPWWHEVAIGMASAIGLCVAMTIFLAWLPALIDRKVFIHHRGRHSRQKVPPHRSGSGQPPTKEYRLIKGFVLFCYVGQPESCITFSPLSPPCHLLVGVEKKARFLLRVSNVQLFVFRNS